VDVVMDFVEMNGSNEDEVGEFLERWELGEISSIDHLISFLLFSGDLPPLKKAMKTSIKDEFGNVNALSILGLF